VTSSWRTADSFREEGVRREKILEEGLRIGLYSWNTGSQRFPQISEGVGYPSTNSTTRKSFH